jgi:hypothetical protein
MRPASPTLFAGAVANTDTESGIKPDRQRARVTSLNLRRFAILGGMCALAILGLHEGLHGEDKAAFASQPAIGKIVSSFGCSTMAYVYQGLRHPATYDVVSQRSTGVRDEPCQKAYLGALNWHTAHR